MKKHSREQWESLGAKSKSVQKEIQALIQEANILDIDNNAKSKLISALNHVIKFKDKAENKMYLEGIRGVDIFF